MLILSRREGESIIIGEGESQMTITVLEVQGKRVRLGITAPLAVNIRRSELEPKPKEPPCLPK